MEFSVMEGRSGALCRWIRVVIGMIQNFLLWERDLGLCGLCPSVRCMVRPSVAHFAKMCISLKWGPTSIQILAFYDSICIRDGANIRLREYPAPDIRKWHYLRSGAPAPYYPAPWRIFQSSDNL